MLKTILQKIRHTKIARKYLVVFLLAILVLTPLAVQEAQAENLIETGAKAMLCAMGGIDCITNWIRSFITVLIAFVGSGIDIALHQTVANVPVVQQSWEIVRGFANMFFILALIIMAFATIFNVSRYDFRTLIVRFLIAVLLINFSLVIGEIIIDWSQSFSDVFLQAIGQVSVRITQGVNISDNFKTAIQSARILDSTTWIETLANGVNIIMLSILLFSMVTLLFFSIIRIPILWALLILSPIAWVTYILPTTMDVNRRWWKYFISWNVFMPIYLFFIYFGTLFLNEQSTLMSNTAPLLSDFGLTFQMIFFYILVALFLIGGAKFAMSSSMAAGAGGVAGAIWAKSRATARFAGAVPYRVGKYGVGLGWRASGAEGVYSEAKDKFKREGFAGFEQTEKNLGRLYRGERGRDEAAARLGQATGLAPGLAQKQLARNIDAERSKLKERRLGETALRTEIATATDPARRIAAAQQLQEEFGRTPDVNEISSVVNALGDVNTELGAKTLKQIKWEELPADDLRQFLDRTNPRYIADANVQSLILNALIDKGRAREDEIQEAIRLAKSGQQRGGIVKKSREFLGKSLTGSQRKILLTGLGTAPENNEARRELLKIMSEESDSFFHDSTTGAPNNTELENYANLFENVGDRRKFLENVSQKDAGSAAMIMLDNGMFRDDSGTPITRASHANAEEQALRQTLRKLSVEDKLTQHRGQYSNANFQQRLAEDMSKNSSSLQDYLKNDKYASARNNIGGAGQAEELARNAIFARQYLQPFQMTLGRANNLLRSMGPKTYASRTALDQDIRQVRDELSDLKKVRTNYEDLYRYNNILSPNGQLDSHTQAQINNFDAAIQILNSRLTGIANTKKTKNP